MFEYGQKVRNRLLPDLGHVVSDPDGVDGDIEVFLNGNYRWVKANEWVATA